MAELGCQMVKVDVDQACIGMLRKDASPVYEEGFEPLLRRHLATGRLRFSDDLLEAVAYSKIVFIAVGSPTRNDGQADITQVVEVAEAIAHCLNYYKLIVLKSTGPVSTVELLRAILHREQTEGQDFDIVANPEFLREGMRQLYAPLIYRQMKHLLNI